MKKILFAILFGLCLNIYGQDPVVRSVRFEAQSEAQMNAIPANKLQQGSVCYRSDTNSIWRYNGTTWAELSGGSLTDGDKGDITVTGGVWDIDAGVVGSAEIANGSIDELDLDVSVNASLDLADSSTQPGDNVSTLTNDAGYITSQTDDQTAAEVPLTDAANNWTATNLEALATETADSLSAKVNINPNSAPVEVFRGTYAEAQAEYGVDPNTWPAKLFGIIPDYPTTQSSLDDLSDVTKGSPAANSSATLRVLADPNTDGNYNEVDWTPPIPDNTDFVDLTTNQTIGGAKTFSSQTGHNQISLISGANNIVVGALDGSSYFLNPSNPSLFNANFSLSLLTSATRTYNFPDASGTFALTSSIPDNTDFVDLTSNQLIDGLKTFVSDYITIDNTLGGLSTDDSRLRIRNSTVVQNLESANFGSIYFLDDIFRVAPSDGVSSAFNLGFDVSSLTATQDLIFTDTDITWNGTSLLSGGGLASTDIDTYAELNSIVADVTLTHNGLIDTFAELNTIVADETLSKAGDNVSIFTNDAGYITSAAVGGIVASGTQALGEVAIGTEFTVNHNLGYVPDLSRILLNYSDIVNSDVATVPTITSITSTQLSFAVGGTTGKPNMFVNWAIFGSDNATPMTGAEIESSLDTELVNTRWKAVEVPSGGTAGQVLEKVDGTDYNVQWASVVETAQIQIACSDLTTDITTGTTKAYFRMPYAMTVTEVRVSLLTAGTTTGITVDINEGGVSILSTLLTTDATEKTSTTATTAAVISDSALADDAEITIDFDAVPTGGQGVIVTIIGTKA